MLGGADVLLRAGPAADPVRAKVAAEAETGNRVVLLAEAVGDLEGDRLPSVLRPAAIVALGDATRPDAAETLRYFEEQDVAVKVISGDDPRTVGVIAARLGLQGADRPVDIDVHWAVGDGDGERAGWAGAGVACRLQPEAMTATTRAPA